jgi:hypothetical protein
MTVLIGKDVGEMDVAGKVSLAEKPRTDVDELGQ